jgi:hypothetical protein
LSVQLTSHLLWAVSEEDSIFQGDAQMVILAATSFIAVIHKPKISRWAQLCDAGRPERGMPAQDLSLLGQLRVSWRGSPLFLGNLEKLVTLCPLFRGSFIGAIAPSYRKQIPDIYRDGATLRRRTVVLYLGHAPDGILGGPEVKFHTGLWFFSISTKESFTPTDIQMASPWHLAWAEWRYSIPPMPTSPAPRIRIRALIGSR